MVELINAGADVRRAQNYLEQYDNDPLPSFDGLVEKRWKASSAARSLANGHSAAANALRLPDARPAHEANERVWELWWIMVSFGGRQARVMQAMARTGRD